MIDRYTKILLTVIALALVALVFQQSGAQAQFGIALGCDGSVQSPCFIRLLN